jgi:hypothetical protein
MICRSKDIGADYASANPPHSSFSWATDFLHNRHITPRECEGMFEIGKPSLRANGSRERAPDDRLREAIHLAA